MVPPNRSRIRARLLTCAVFLLLFATVLALQTHTGAYRCELGSHPDEAAHFVTGLMMHDYVARGFRGSPMRFAQDFYSHYPKVGLGIWPPFFYAVQTVWSVVGFGDTPAAILVLLAALTAGLAGVLFLFLKRELGIPAGVLGAGLLLMLPLTQQYSAMIMAEVLSALTMFAATLFWGRFLDGEKPRDALAFGLCAALAILTKGTGLALAFVPVFTIAASRRFRILRRPALWWSALLVMLLAGPWTWIFRNQGRGGWAEPSPSWHFSRMAAGYYSWKICVALGLLLLALAVLGAWVVFWRKGERRDRRGVWSACAALVAGVVIFQCIMPVGLEARHLLPALPALVAFAVAGADFLARFCQRAVVYSAVAALSLSGIFFPPQTAIGFGSIGDTLALSPFRLPQKQFSGFGPIAARLLADDRARTILVSSDARGEGMFISEMAWRDPARPSRTIQRASKILAASTWSGGSYQSFFSNEEAVEKALADARATVIVLDNSVPNPPPHQKLLRATLEHHPERFTALPPAAITRDAHPQPEAICVYLVAQNSP